MTPMWIILHVIHYLVPLIRVGWTISRIPVTYLLFHTLKNIDFFSLKQLSYFIRQQNWLNHQGKSAIQLWTIFATSGRMSDPFTFRFLVLKNLTVISLWSLKKLLQTKADAFLSNDYYDSDIAWMELVSMLYYYYYFL